MDNEFNIDIIMVLLCLAALTYLVRSRQEAIVVGTILLIGTLVIFDYDMMMYKFHGVLPWFMTTINLR